MRAVLTAALLALTLAPAAAAENSVEPIEEVAKDLAYGYCPLFLMRELSLGGPELAYRGFGPEVVTQPHPRFGTLSMMGATHAQGELGFGGVPGKICTVSIDAPAARAAVVKRLQDSMQLTGLDFVPVANPGSAEANDAVGAVETYRAPVEDMFLYVQIIQMGGRASSGPVLAQLYALDQ